MIRTLSLLLLAAGAVSCAAPAPFPAAAGEYAELVPESGRIEVGLSADGSVGEVEFHVAPAELPAEVLAAAREELGELVAAEIEWHGGQLYYEAAGLSPEGREGQAMFTAAGALYSFEIAVAAEEVPAGIREAASNWRGWGEIRAYEEIRDGARALQEYHVKKTVGGKKYKLIFALDGALVRVFRETPAEIEVVVE